jgi:hypothetical protein
MLGKSGVTVRLDDNDEDDGETGQGVVAGRSLAFLFTADKVYKRLGYITGSLAYRLVLISRGWTLLDVGCGQLWLSCPRHTYCTAEGSKAATCFAVANVHDENRYP